MLLEITHVADEHDARHVVLQSGRSYVIGGGGADIVLPDSTVSPKHLRLTVDGEQLLVEDLGSTSGSFVDDVHIARPTLIELWQYVRIGETLLRVTPGDRPPAHNVFEERARTTVEDGFLDALRATPADDVTRAVYADWLESEGHRVTAKFIRIELAGGRDIYESEDVGRAVGITQPAWRAIVSRGRIVNCFVRGCPLRWHLLAPVGAMKRSCQTCSEPVHYVMDDDDRGVKHVFDASVVRLRER